MMYFVEYVMAGYCFGRIMCKAKYTVACDAYGKNYLYLRWLPIDNQMPS